MRYNDSVELSMNRIKSPSEHPPQIPPEILSSCRNHLESLQNLRYLILLEVNQPSQVKLHLRMMEQHLNNLAGTLLHGQE